MPEDFFNPPSNVTDEPYEVFDLELSDSRLVQMVSKSLDDSIAHWNQWPYNLDQNDRSNLKYWLGEQMREPYSHQRGDHLPNMGNRMMTSTRAVLAYVNSRVANPEVAPSTNEAEAKQFALDARSAMYQHGVDHDLVVKAKKATTSLVIQKRGFLKLRFDPTCGPYGDIEVDFISPENIVVEKSTRFRQNPGKIFERQTCTIEELCDLRFPKKKDAIFKSFDYKRGVYTQLNRMVSWWESWFSFIDEQKRKEGVLWYLPQGKVIMGKMLNPNWIYTGDDQKDREINYSTAPIKPYVVFNYLNTGKSYIDETSLFEQAKVLQDLYNKRKKQIMENNDYINGRSVADADAMNQEDADKFYSKGPKAILLIKPQQGQTVSSSFVHVPHNPLPVQSTEEAYDTRDQIDETMGSSAALRGQADAKAETLGENELLLQRASALQDDLASSVDEAMQDYYRKLFQMMKVYYTEDHWFQVRGDDGKYDFIVMHGDRMDTNVKVSVESGSTLPSNKQEIRKVATEAANANKIDDLSFWEAMIYGKLPDPETIVERTQKQLNDPASYLSDVEKELFNREAATDLVTIIGGLEPPERDEYGQAYLEYFNRFIMKPKFLKLSQEDPEAAERIKVHLASIGMLAARTANLQATQVDDAAQAGMTEQDVALTQ